MWHKRITNMLWQRTQGAQEQPFTIWCLNVMAEDITGMLSYPNAANARFMPRVDWLARAAQDANVRLYVINLLRDAVSLEASVRSRFQKNYAVRWGSVDAEHPVAAAMHAQAVALSSQIGTLLREQLMCLDYDTLPRGAAVLDRILCRHVPCTDWSFSSAAIAVFRPSRSVQSVADSLFPPSHLLPLQKANQLLIHTCKAKAGRNRV